MIAGKTKILAPLWEKADIGLVTTKDDITAGDGAKHDVMPGKAELATKTTCNIFNYLQSMGIPVAFIGRDGPITFITRICKMIPIEVVVRNIAFGSYCKRHPEVVTGTVFENPVVEFFYKTDKQRIGDQTLPCDDPLIKLNSNRNQWDLYVPYKPPNEGYICRLNIPDEEAVMLKCQLEKCWVIANNVNKYLYDAWQMLGGTLYDLKLEFGFLPDGSIVLADVVDCDSWRVMWGNIQLSKQGYRDGDDLARVLGVYRLAASLTDQLT